MKLKKLVSRTKETNNLKPKYANLKEVMDYSRDFTMFYSGVEYEAYLDGCYNMGIRNFLMSYEYLKTKGASQLKKYTDMHLFIDSGAFTYMNDAKFENYKVEDWEKQIELYLNWADKHKDSIFALSELDLQYLVGLEVVQGWREKYFEPFMLRTGVPVCFIYHNEGADLWEKMCQRYPLVGFSSVADTGSARDMGDYKELLRVAEKYNSLVHGFGMTKTSLLPELPFYTVDSTSWKSGFRYGLLSIWNGKKVQQFKKEEWDTRVIPVLRSYQDISFDEEQLWQFYEPEILRANVYAYMRAEEYIRERQKALTYWKRAKAVKRDIENLPDDFFPSAEWFIASDPMELAEYAKKMNINPDYSDLRGLVYDVTTILNWDNPDYAEMREEYSENDCAVVKSLHDLYINRIVADSEERIKDLVAFFKDCIAGENDKLLQMGTNFDRTVKERDRYLEDEEEFDYLDIPEQDVRSRVRDVLALTTSSAEDSGEQEFEDLDREIFTQAEIVPTFDSKGKFVKGQMAVRKPKQLYSKLFPKYACDTCYAAAKCPEFKAGFVCAYQEMFKRFDTRNATDIIEAMQGMANHNLQRMQRAMIMEVINGTIDGNVTSFINQNMAIMNNIRQLYNSSSAEVLRQTKVVRGDGSQEITTQVTNPQGGGILDKLFATIQSKSDEEPLEEEAPPKKKTIKYEVEENE